MDRGLRVEMAFPRIFKGGVTLAVNPDGGRHWISWFGCSCEGMFAPGPFCDLPWSCPWCHSCPSSFAAPPCTRTNTHTCSSHPSTRLSTESWNASGGKGP